MKRVENGDASSDQDASIASRAASVAHDLRVLIAVIDQRLRLLKGGEVSALQRMRVAHAAAQRALELAEDLVKIAGSKAK